MIGAVPFYIFVGLIHNYYLPDTLINVNVACTDKKLSETNTSDTLNTCLQPAINLTEFENLIDRHPGEPYKFIQKRCSLKPVADNCLDIAFEDINDCYNSTILEGIKTWKNIDNEVTDYVCKNNAEVARDLFEKTEFRCWNRAVSRALDKCSSVLNVTAELYDIQGISQQCSNIEDYEICLKNVIGDDCSDKILDIEKTIMRIIKKHVCIPQNHLLLK